MLIDLERLLSTLPVAEEDTATGIVLRGWRVPGAPRQLRILVGELCLCFAEDDVLEMKPGALAESPLQPASLSGIVAVVRRGAPLLDMCLSKAYEGLFPGRKPFALSVRPFTIRKNLSPEQQSSRLDHQTLHRPL